MDFPEEWDTNEIEFYLNNSSYCCDNLINLLQGFHIFAFSNWNENDQKNL